MLPQQLTYEINDKIYYKNLRTLLRQLLSCKISNKRQLKKQEPIRWSFYLSWVNPFPKRVINRAIFFYNALDSHECACCLLSFLYFHWLFPLLARETSPGNRSIYKSTRERVDSKGLCGRWRLHLMGSWKNLKYLSPQSLACEVYQKKEMKLKVCSHSHAARAESTIKCNKG